MKFKMAKYPCVLCRIFYVMSCLYQPCVLCRIFYVMSCLYQPIPKKNSLWWQRASLCRGARVKSWNLSQLKPLYHAWAPFVPRFSVWNFYEAEKFTSSTELRMMHRSSFWFFYKGRNGMMIDRMDPPFLNSISRHSGSSSHVWWLLNRRGTKIWNGRCMA